MRIILINLDEDVERRGRVESRLAALGLHWERLSAVHGTRLTRQGSRPCRRGS